MVAKTECIIAVFAKAPRPGEVKTRLIPVLGAEGAATLQSRLLGHTVDTIRASGLGPRELWCSPDTRDPVLQKYAARAGATLHDQGDGDVGERMARAFAAMLKRAKYVLLIGCDCPCLTAQDLRDAAIALQVNDAVFTPAEDGGYALVGLRRADARLFSGIVWSGATVMRSTRERLATLGWRSYELSARWDVDRPEDLDRLHRHPRLAQLVRGLCDPPHEDAG
jgi:rSAM/selenodomain-associated transferase 1